MVTVILVLYFFTYGKAHFHIHINHIRYVTIHSPVLKEISGKLVSRQYAKLTLKQRVVLKRRKTPPWKTKLIHTSNERNKHNTTTNMSSMPVVLQVCLHAGEFICLQSGHEETAFVYRYTQASWFHQLNLLVLFLTFTPSFPC